MCGFFQLNGIFSSEEHFLLKKSSGDSTPPRLSVHPSVPPSLADVSELVSDSGPLSEEDELALLGGGVFSSSFSQEKEPHWLTSVGFSVRSSSLAMERSPTKSVTSSTIGRRSRRGRGSNEGFLIRRRLVSRLEYSSFFRKTSLIRLGLTFRARGRFHACSFSVHVLDASSRRPRLTKSSKAYNSAAM